jgi:hypothetical protein
MVKVARSEETSFFKADTNAVNEPCSVVEGYPRLCQLQFQHRRMDRESRHTLDVEVGRPISFDVRGHPFSSSM